MTNREEFVQRAYSFADLKDYSLKERFLIRLASLAFYVAIKLIGATIKTEKVGVENYEAVVRAGKLPVLSIWHDRIFTLTYLWANYGIVVMTSRSFDGEYIARLIQMFGFGAARGSSTRGAVGGIVEMVRLMRAGCPTGFTIDGPKGPPHVAKMGSVMLAKKSGHPVVPLNVTLDRYWTVSSWDSFQIPKPFTRARMELGAPIYVAADADESLLQAKRDELQNALDDLTRRGEEWRTNLQSSK